MLTCCPCLKGMVVKKLVAMRVSPDRIPLLKTPQDYDMEFVDVDIPSPQLLEPTDAKFRAPQSPESTVKWLYSF